MSKFYQNVHIYYIRFCIRFVVLNRSYSTNTQQIWKLLYSTGAWESQTCFCNNFLIFILHLAVQYCCHVSLAVSRDQLIALLLVEVLLLKRTCTLFRWKLLTQKSIIHIYIYNNEVANFKQIILNLCIKSKMIFLFSYLSVCLL